MHTRLGIFISTSLVISFLVFASCEQNNSGNQDLQMEHTDSTKVVKSDSKPNRPSAFEKGKFFEMGGKPMLYGGEDSTQHFDISNIDLVKEQFHYGIGRERFPALLKPEFVSVKEADIKWDDSTRFLLAQSGEEVKVYSVTDLTRHEVVNDEINGEPIMAAYCVLADLGAIYSRNYDGNELTFGLSGYTYYDPQVWDGLDGFVLWDRETESLWWPLTGKSVSGPLKDVKLLELDRSMWKDLSWKEIKKDYPNAKVLKSGQDYERPSNWDKTINVEQLKKQFTI